MAPPVPRAGSRVRGGPAPRCPTSSGATLSLSRGGRPGGPARGGAAHLPASAQSPAHLGGPARPSTAAGARGVTEGARRESGRGGATSLPPSAGRPGELASAYPAVPKRAGFSRSRPPTSVVLAGAAPRAPAQRPGGRDLAPEGDRVFRVATPFQRLHLSPCDCPGLAPAPDRLLCLPFRPRGACGCLPLFPVSLPAASRREPSGAIGPREEGREMWLGSSSCLLSGSVFFVFCFVSFCFNWVTLVNNIM